VLDTGCALAAGALTPREGAWRMVEVLFQLEAMGSANSLTQVLVPLHALMTLRDEANEIASASTAGRSAEFRGYTREYDAKLLSATGGLLADHGLSGGSLASEIRQAARTAAC
jgi:hypothetical protein